MGLQRRHQRGAIAIEREHHLAVRALRLHLGRKSRVEIDALAGPQPLPGPGERAPAARRHLLVQRRLDPRLAAPSPQAGGNDPGIVEHHDVAGPQQPGKIPRRPILQGVADREQARGVARRHRPLGDGVDRKREVEVVDPHGKPPRVGSRGGEKTIKDH